MKIRGRRKDLIKATNTPAGSPIYIGEERTQRIKVSYTEYSKREYYKKDDITTEQIENFLGHQNDKIKWLRVMGIHKPEKINELCEPLHIHPLVVEDILDTTSRARIEDYEEYLFIITKRMYYTRDEELSIEQISFLLFKDRLVSFQELESNIFKNIENRLKEGGSTRKGGVGDLLYSLLDSIVDNYFLLVEDIGEKIDIVEDELLLDPDEDILEKIYILKRDLIYIRNSLWPMRNVLSKLSKDKYDFIDGRTVYYMRDISDNVIQVIDLVEIYREICSGMLDTYLSSIGNKTNEVMKVLTIFSTIFIPLSFLAGVFGMNFKYMPELNWEYSYATFWIISLAMTGIMFRYFKKKDWF